MAWSFCEEVEGACASCASCNGEDRVCRATSHGVPLKDSKRFDGFATHTCGCILSSTEGFEVVFPNVHICDAHYALKFAPQISSANHGSSEPVTPFADYIDRALVGATFEERHYAVPSTNVARLKSSESKSAETFQSTTDPLYINSYRAAAEPLSEWIATHVWKLCTTGNGLADKFAQHGYKIYSPRPPQLLSQMIRNLLWSTLLQPSGVLLALWYIRKFPVHLDWVVQGGTVTPQEHEFRTEMMVDLPSCDGSESVEGAQEGRIVFRLVLLGFMLANKWLDDHTFSNKTWHSITQIPVGSINRLELIGLALLKHDLSITQAEWYNWLMTLRQDECQSWMHFAPYRGTSSSKPTPVVQNAVDTLLRLCNSNTPLSLPVPLFSPLLTGSVTQNANEEFSTFDPFEIDLDEDGPLRDEYVPRRGSVRGPRYKPSPPAMFTTFDCDTISPILHQASWSPNLGLITERTVPLVGQVSSQSRVNPHTGFMPSDPIMPPFSGPGTFNFLKAEDRRFTTALLDEIHRPFVGHTRSTSMVSIPIGFPTAHNRSLSSQFFYDNTDGLPATRGYLAFTTTVSSMNDALPHSKPVCLNQW